MGLEYLEYKKFSLEGYGLPNRLIVMDKFLLQLLTRQFIFNLF